MQRNAPLLVRNVTYNRRNSRKRVRYEKCRRNADKKVAISNIQKANKIHVHSNTSKSRTTNKMEYRVL